MSNSSIIQTAAGAAAVRYSSRKTLAISVLPDGKLELIAPRNAPERAIMQKVAKRLRWILRQKLFFQQLNRNEEKECYLSGATLRYLGRQYRLKVIKGNSDTCKLIGRFFKVEAKESTPEYIKGIHDAWMRERAIFIFSERLSAWGDWCTKRGLPPPKLRLLRMPNRWGSAHKDGRIYLNPKLIKASSRCIDYVIAHEVCHLKHPNHDKSFFRLLRQLYPEWEKVKRILEETTF